MENLVYHRKALHAEGYDTSAIDALAEKLSVVSTLAELNALLAQIDREAKPLGWPRDSDYGALLIQAAVPTMPTAEMKRAALEFAIGRAQWCATCATSGGEGMARARHMRELERELSAVAG